MPFGLLACLLLALPASAQTREDAERRRAEEAAFEARLAALPPDAPFTGFESMPFDFLDHLHGGGLLRRRLEEPPLSNGQALALFRAWRLRRLLTVDPSSLPDPPPPWLAQAPPEPPPPAWRRLLDPPQPPSDWQAQAARFDGAGPPPAAVPMYDVPLASPEGGPGLRFLGIELGRGPDFADGTDEPYLRKGLQSLFNWDVRLRLREDRLGLRASYRHPRHFRSLRLSAERYVDLPAVLGAGEARDDLYQAFGADPPRDKSGWRFRGAGTVNEYIGLFGGYDEQLLRDPGARDEHREVDVGAGYSPLGDNDGERWNYTLIGSLNHRRHRRLSGEETFDRQGFGYSLAVAFQLALEGLTEPWRPPLKGVDDLPEPSERRRWILFDRLKTTLGVSDSEIADLSLDAAVQLELLLARRLGVSGGVQLHYRPELKFSTEHVDVGPLVGLKLNF